MSINFFKKIFSSFTSIFRRSPTKKFQSYASRELSVCRYVVKKIDRVLEDNMKKTIDNLHKGIILISIGTNDKDKINLFRQGFEENKKIISQNIIFNSCLLKDIKELKEKIKQLPDNDSAESLNMRLNYEKEVKILIDRKNEAKDEVTKNLDNVSDNITKSIAIMEEVARDFKE